MKCRNGRRYVFPITKMSNKIKTHWYDLNNEGATIMPHHLSVFPLFCIENTDIHAF